MFDKASDKECDQIRKDLSLESESQQTRRPESEHSFSEADSADERRSCVESETTGLAGLKAESTEPASSSGNSAVDPKFRVESEGA